ncbi:MAG TPA: transcriptional regulator [Elusimicrobia bacterium]|nr:MAG: hypothetical protein A2386_04550 [Elusimicrobia bacterium RIFOXYB1_FULL_48_9]OGS14865.1 MAG: hypothetical protein A2251_04820 [Elusimicrobia bacterium RIFOXYA2_FULL_47_53]OGS25854.1 MAG: hypothetical protein A2339_03630 [Elusimicrobia bacterium RIFOXYB12_FULL_50_12]OGS29912.1 MAG: hypothetical protein A2323_03690 [Elusimicrobia bacterium RIFOXYB2_FULL_46_23]HBU70539.1 transcriptional regulator [Elusimicrobiota bacterium]
MDYNKTSELLKALGNPVRLQILNGLISSHGCNVNTIVEQLRIPQSTASQHLGILKSRGILTHKKEGVKTCYKVSDKRIEKLLQMFSK